MSSDIIYVLDTETTGLRGYPYDHVVDIGVCAVDLEAGTVEPVLSKIVGHDVTKWDEETKNAWIFQNTDLTLEQVADASSVYRVALELRSTLNAERVTSFNYWFDFDQFLNHYPWDLYGYVLSAPCIMLKSMDICKIPGKYGQYKWPKLQEAYDMITTGDPAGIEGKQTHRALSDAVMASHILLELNKRGAY